MSLDLGPEGNASEVWVEGKEVRACVHCPRNVMTQIQEAGKSVFRKLRNIVSLMSSHLLSTCHVPGTVLGIECIVVRYVGRDKQDKKTN